MNLADNLVVVRAAWHAYNLALRNGSMEAARAAKQAKNESRTWPDWRTMSEDGAIEHDRANG
jgi:hypothetical protein